ncbi:MAG: acyloxyacyl hydrolase [Bacteroidales bacterium]|nr:acyloxyacyl hydrolase [Bacteroidales bacterium]
MRLLTYHYWKKTYCPFLLLGFLGVLPFTLKSQSEHKLFTSNLFIESKIHYGFLYAHHLELEIFNAHFPAFEVSIQQQTYGKYKWERAFAYPIIGFTCWYSGLGSSQYLGKAIGLMPFVNFPLYRHKNFCFGFRFALGLGILTKKFDRIENYKNTAIGSTLNAAINMMFEGRYRINTWLTASAGISLQHFSNGSLKMPNYGLNALMINVGLAYWPKRQNKEIGDRFYPPTEPYSAVIQRHIEFNIGVSTGYKNMEAVLGKNFFVFHIYENTFYQISRKSKVGLGLDLSYDPSHTKILEIQGDTIENPLTILRPGINGAYQLVLGKMGLIFNIGYYLGGAEKSNGPLYEKFSIQYNFSKNFFANLMLKVHFGRADYLGIGLGYKFVLPFGKKILKG